MVAPLKISSHLTDSRADDLIRSEIFSAERLEQHAESLAQAQTVDAKLGDNLFLHRRLKRNEVFLREAYRHIAKAIGDFAEIPPAAEWIIDNYFVLEEHIRDIRSDLPPGYYNQLPKLADGFLKGYPRVYGLAWAYIAHTDSFFNPGLLEKFVRAYQRHTPLNIAELWAIVIALRVALVENVRRAAHQVIEDRRARFDADLVAERLLKLTDEGKVLEKEFKRFNYSDLPSAFYVQLIQRLRDQDPRIVPFLQRIDQQLHERGASVEEIVRLEHQRQSALTVTVRNIITSMRLIATFDWVRFIETVSLIDERLRAESPFAAMDLPTRNLYRHAIEKYAARSRMSELEVTEEVLKLSAAAGTGQQPLEAMQRQQDPGYYLLDAGQKELRRRIGYRPALWDRISHVSTSANFAVYIVTNILFVTGIIELGLAATVHEHAFTILLVLAAAVFFPAWEASITLVNRLVIALKAPAILPSMALREGIPDAFRTMVVMPTLLGNDTDILAQIEQLEVHYLSNVDDNLYFALLSDWKDADTESTPHDERQLAFARDEVATLNKRHPTADGTPRFFLLHRRRLWNPQQDTWMGWERKRGKLQELNKLLRGVKDTTFLWENDQAQTRVPQDVRFVITLDVDTRLPRGTVRRLIGKMAHPLNRARIDPVLNYVTEGYGILQPRVSSSLPKQESNSFFQRIFYSASGIDPYAFAVSDIYQDLFQEGSYIGKGIYDIDAFEHAGAGRIPDNIVLSHDLLEGIFARAGLVSDIEVIEEFPSRYDVASSRQHRWTRGDWQLLPWIFGPPSRTIPALGHWKMVDNLRRTFTAPFTFLALLLGWTFPLNAASLWTALIIGSFSMPLLLSFAESLVPSRRVSWPTYFFATAKNGLRTLEQIVLLVAFLPHQAWTMMDAVVRTLWRLFVSHKNLLEWVTANETVAKRERSIAGFYRYMSGGLLITVVALGVLLFDPSAMWSLASSFVVLWLLGPAIAQISSRPVANYRFEPLNDDDKKEYRLIARQTWHFFEHFVTAKDNDLPPDNFQEDPVPVTARRTSPTNIGLYLLAIIAAQDFGWLSPAASYARLARVFDTLAKMQRFRGHFYNWYATADLQPLAPRYISAVDSGNLAAYFLIVAQVAEQAPATPLLSRSWMTGLNDTVNLLRDALEAIKDETQKTVRKNLLSHLADLTDILQKPGEAPSMLASFETLREIEQAVAVITDLCSLFTLESVSPARVNLEQWAKDLQRTVHEWSGYIDRFAPWLRHIPAPQQQAPEDAALWQLLGGTPPRYEDMFDFYDQTEALLSSMRAPNIESIKQALVRSKNTVAEYLNETKAIGEKSRAFFNEMDFRFLLDKQRQLLSIGYRVEDGALDPSCYDLLASEARLTSMVAIAKGDIPAQSWFRLGRTVTSIAHRPVLVSWSGSMFEYLMPSLVVREPSESLIGQTNRMVVRRQIDYGKERGIPWGVSESAYSARDFEFTYQYFSFGIPGLGLKRGLSENIVIASYATALAAMIDPKTALENLHRLQSIGGRGHYGWYEAFDFTKKRLPEGENVAIVKNYMAHHQGMSLIAILNVLTDGLMRDRFHAEPIIQATELLLQEMPPRNIAVTHPRFEEVEKIASIHEISATPPRCFKSPHGSIPRTNLLSNGTYTVMTTAAGSGYSQCRDNQITRWREDATRDAWGSYIYIRDVNRDKVWSATYQPVCADPDTYNVAYFEDRSEYVRRDDALQTTLNIVVSSEDQGEVRRLSILNQGSVTHDVELTSYAELVLTDRAADMAHPAFAKMFVETEFLPESNVLLATRRLRAPDEVPIWAVHLVSIGGQNIGDVQYETDRMRFIGRGRTLRDPQALDGRPLGNSVGTVLDPIFSLRCRVRLKPGTVTHVAFWTLIAGSREEALDLVDKYRSPNAYNRASAHAWTQAQLQYQHLGIMPEEAHLFQRLANHALYASRHLRAHPEALKRSAGTQSMLWQVGISGDKPIVLMRVDVVSDMKTLRQMIKAHEYWSSKQLEVDLVIINEQPTSYLDNIQSEIELLVRTSQALPRATGKLPRGAIYTLRADQMPPHIVFLLQAAARLVIIGHRGSLAEQMALQLRDDTLPYNAHYRRFVIKSEKSTRPLPQLEFFNGTGGFADQGRSYVAWLEPGQNTPAPWINVIANPRFGFHVSAEGAGYTWSLNSRENKITPWSNDPVSDEPGEAIYFHDLESNAIWSPTASPVRRSEGTYIAKHGMGFSEFETTLYGIETKLTQCVPLHDAVKISALKIRNVSYAARRLSVSSYTEWVLGAARGSTASLVTTDIDRDMNMMLATNPWNNTYGGCNAFVHMSGKKMHWTGDRREFIGRNGNLQNPAALRPGKTLSGNVGAGLDACAVLQSVIELKPGQEIEIRILLGEASHADDARKLVARYRDADFNAVMKDIAAYWDTTLGAVSVKTPDRAMDIVLNGWLMYQTIACRVFARSAFYQTSGAYGYRDQLQDVMSLAHNHPELTRAHILRAAGRQFPEGDVQHWWLPSDHNAGQGIRTRFADDALWLPYVTAYYIAVTGDAGILQEDVTFLDGKPLDEHQHEAFFLPEYSDRSATLHEHCALAIDRIITMTGEHGLLLFGGGDWNDGMNRVGIGGKGESLWMCWFMLTVIKDFLPYLDPQETARVSTWQRRAEKLKASIEENGWDGGWYRRGYYDDGTPLGSAQSLECKIDSIAQSWSVISGEAPPERQRQAMQAMAENLIKPADSIALLFTPAFDKTPKDPGYIKGYPVGLRENGGQYTHAALWSVLAYTHQGEGGKAFALYDMLNPIRHADSRSASYRYKVEPYVVAADIYSNPQHMGRGGWTWYTGSAGWMYRIGVESILGLQLHGDHLHMKPCIPAHWPGFEMTYRYKTTFYRIKVVNKGSNCVTQLELDSAAVPVADGIALVDDQKQHNVMVTIG